MGHLSRKLDSVSRLRDGRLDELPFATVLTAIAASGRNAVIELNRTPFNKQIILEEGVPVDCRSNLAHETFGRFLLTAKKLSEEEFSTTLNEAATRGVPHGQVLVDRGLISPSELFRMLQQNLARKLLDPFTWRAGSFSISFEVPEVESPLKVRVPQLVLTGIAKFADQGEIDRAMNPLIGKTLVRNPLPPFRPEDVRLSPLQKSRRAVILRTLDVSACVFLPPLLVRAPDVHSRQCDLQGDQCPRAIMRPPHDPQDIAHEEHIEADLAAPFLFGADEPGRRDGGNHRRPLDQVDQIVQSRSSKWRSRRS